MQRRPRRGGRLTRRRRLIVHPVHDALAGGIIAAVVSGLPFTAHALLTGGDPWAATLVAGSLLLPHETRHGRVVAAAGVLHGALSLGWALVLARTLPRHHTAAYGTLAGLGIVGIDLGIVGRRLPTIRALPRWPQVADHIAYGGTVGVVISRRGRP